MNAQAYIYLGILHRSHQESHKLGAVRLGNVSKKYIADLHEKEAGNGS